VTTALHEWAEACGNTLSIDEGAIPTSPEVKGACELLGLDPLNMANEGTMLVAVPAGWADRAVEVLGGVTESKDSARIGEVRPRIATPVTVRRSLGIERPLEEPLGAPLPRIC
jgi:hydrogenase expression/formation protein HypE